MSKIEFNQNLPELQGCEDLTNGIVMDFNGHTTVIARCWVPLNATQKNINPGAKLTSIKVINNDQVSVLNAQDSAEYIAFNGNSQKQDVGHFWGPEDPRLFEFKNELYLYYCMTNPNAQKPYRSMEILSLADIMNSKSAPVRGRFLDPIIFDNDKREVEKNWLFFSNKTDILVLYSLKPFIFGDIVGNSLVARFQREYPCLSRFGGVHFGSNAITIKNNGRMEMMFIFNDRSSTLTYIPYLGFMEAEVPFNLLRIAQMPLGVDATHQRLVYPSSMTVKNKNTLTAEFNDVILISGGVDDNWVFRQAFKLQDLLGNYDTTSCNTWNEHDYFNSVKFSNVCQTNVIMVYSGVIIALVLLLTLALVIRMKLQRQVLNKKGYNQLHDA